MFRRYILILAALLLPWIARPATAESANLLIYCGITMVRPITEMARKFEQIEGIRITIAQGGSEDLFQSAKRSGLGDLYLPGEPSYYDKHLAEGLFGEPVTVGYNQLGLFVQKGNPRQLKADVRELLRKDLAVVLGNSESGSVGLESKRLLDSLGIYAQVVANAAFLSPDSRSINNAMRRGEADVALNWRATAFFPDNAASLDLLDLDPKLARPQALLLMQLKFSQNPALSRRFIDYVASETGQAIFRKHGFSDARLRASR